MEKGYFLIWREVLWKNDNFYTSEDLNEIIARKADTELQC